MKNFYKAAFAAGAFACAMLAVAPVYGWPWFCTVGGLIGIGCAYMGYRSAETYPQ